MAKISDIFNSIMGLNPNAEYDFSVAERGAGQKVNETVETPTVITKPAPPVIPPSDTRQENNTTTPKPDTVSMQEYEQMTAQLNRATAEINALKELNLTLLLKSPTNSDSELGVDECIASICGINEGGK